MIIKAHGKEISQYMQYHAGYVTGGFVSNSLKSDQLEGDNILTQKM
jgi:hypothetical protein